MASKMTKQQLVDENIRLRAECARLEALVASTVDKTLASKPAVVMSLAGRLAQAKRRELAAHFFACNPNARSVTDIELLQYA